MIRLADTQITDAELLAAIHALNDAEQNASDALCVQEFTTMIDGREEPPTLGFLVELAEPLGASARVACCWDRLAQSDRPSPLRSQRTRSAATPV